MPYCKCYPVPGTYRASQVPDASLPACHALGPRQALQDLTFSDPFVLASGPLKPLPPASSLTNEAELLQRGAFPLAAHRILYVRFTYIVRRINFPPDSAIGATFDRGGWLSLTPQGLPPCKKHQASLGALIGIGRGLTASPLPHHLAYGSRTKAVRLITLARVRPAEFSVNSAQHTICSPKR